MCAMPLQDDPQIPKKRGPLTPEKRAEMLAWLGLEEGDIVKSTSKIIYDDAGQPIDVEPISQHVIRDGVCIRTRLFAKPPEDNGNH